MFKTRKATIGKTELKMDSSFSLWKFEIEEYTPLNIHPVDYVELLGTIVLEMHVTTYRKEKYSAIQWDLVSDCGPVESYIQICNLAKILKGENGKSTRPEQFKGEKVSIIVDDNSNLIGDNIIFGIGRDDKYVIPYWILSSAELEEQKSYYSFEEAKALLEKIVPIAQ